MTDRFERQVRFAPLGREGQERLAASTVLLVGCGATGGVLAQALVRAGVGRLVVVDRDVVDPTNLPRQVLFDEAHAAAGLPKVTAAAETLARAGGPCRVEPVAAHLDADLLEDLGADADLLLDGTDNLATRYLLNDYAVREGKPWIYAGVVGGGGLLLPVLPGRGPCLRCVFPEPPPAGALPTCDTAGVILPAVGAVASLQAGLALRLLGARAGEPELEPALVQVDAWSGEVARIAAERDPGCPACGARTFPFLEDARAPEPVVLCGRNTVQITGSGTADLDELAARLAQADTPFQRVGPLLRFEADAVRVTLFPGGRALVEGTDDPDRARSVYDRYVGA